jgi:putative ABC transport system ATP-binding protein
MIIECSNISKSFHQGDSSINVLKNVDLELIEGETAAILGKSGSGKTTLLSILSGIEKVDSGKIVFNGQDITHLSESALTKFRSQSMGVIFQQFHLIEHLSALENVMLPLEILNDPSPEQKAKELLSSVGLGHRFDHFPSQLSGGEKQRVAIARAMAINPRLLLADEPSGSLDEETGKLVMDLLFDLVKKNGMSLILVTHERSLADRCDHIYKLETGVLSEREKK